jgi:glucan 1,3-beta-glucosidase
MAPWALEDVIIESFGAGGWIRGAALAAAALAAPVVASLTLAANERVPTFAAVLGRAGERPPAAIARVSGLVLVATTVLAIGAALGLVFDPRYRDFIDSELSAAAVPFAIAMALGPSRAGPRGHAETVAAIALAGSALYIVLNEGFANWQALWFGAVLTVLAVTIDRLPGARKT